MVYDDLIVEIDILLGQYNGEISHSSYWNNEVIPTRFYNIDKEIMTELPLDYQIKKMIDIKKRLKKKKDIKDKHIEPLKESLVFVKKSLKIARSFNDYFKRIDKLELEYKDTFDKKKFETIKSIFAKLRYELQTRAIILDLYLDDIEEKISQLEERINKESGIKYRSLESKPLSVADSSPITDYHLDIDNMISEINQHFDFLTFSRTLTLRIKEQKAIGENYIICSDIPESICRAYIDLPENKGLKFVKETGLILLEENSEQSTS
ncbi:MAG: hypothetical protein HGN29_15020 [Asgard group archaeon]|nr:hypothetical protein [Asgard group archaeon]